MHHVTSHGATKITMDSKERDYQERLRQPLPKAMAIKRDGSTA